VEILLLVVGFAVMVGIGVANAVDAKRRKTPFKKDLTRGQKIAVGVAAAVSALGLIVVGFAVLFMMAMASWADSK
jgi:hypothetical protein